MICNRLSYVG